MCGRAYWSDITRREDKACIPEVPLRKGTSGMVAPTYPHRVTVDWASLGSGLIGALVGAVVSIALTLLSERQRRKNDRRTEIRARSERAATEALDLIVQLRDLDDKPETPPDIRVYPDPVQQWNDRRAALIAQLQARTHIVAHIGLRQILSFVADVLNRHIDIVSFAGLTERRSRYIVTWYAMNAVGAVLREEKTLPAEPAEFEEFRGAMEAAEEADKEREGL